MLAVCDVRLDLRMRLLLVMMMVFFMIERS